MAGQSEVGKALTVLTTWARRQEWLRLLCRPFLQYWRNHIAGMPPTETSADLLFAQPTWSPPVSVQRTDRLEVAPRTVRDDVAGVNIFGYIRGQFGLAESARMYARALIGAGLRVRLCDIDLDLPHGWNDRSLDAWIGDEAPYPVSIIFVNPDYLHPALEHIGRKSLEGRYLMACWFWELERIPASWHAAIADVDEIVVASEFVEKAFREATDKPILRVPLPLSRVPDSGLKRTDFGLEDGKFVFLTTFDFNSWVVRKNPFSVLQAFALAFPRGRDDVRLVIKSSNGFRYPEKFRQLLDAAALDPRVVVHDEIMERLHLNALQRCCDAYVSLHRAEGFGLGLAEAMLAGKPVIATGWSGNMEFMNKGNSCLVGYRLVEVRSGEYLEGEGQRWADVDVEEAAAWMRRLVDEPGLAGRIGEAARASVSETLLPQRAAEIIISRLKHIAAESIPMARSAHGHHVDAP